VLSLAALDDLPQTEIAKILGVPVGTVYSRLHQARERLRERLAATRAEPAPG
jgi:RNA polymerase sigma-70 factor (ECF subfamily)